MTTCALCKQEMTTGASCSVSALHQQGVARALSIARRRCGDCGVDPGGFHHLGCDMQRCPACRGQLISCGCTFDEDGFADIDDDYYDDARVLQLRPEPVAFEHERRR